MLMRYMSRPRFQGRRNTMIVAMLRPSPQVPEPSVKAARMCYDACIFNVRMHRDQVRTGSVDLTWIFTQSVFMALNTILWSLSYPEIRAEHSIEDVTESVNIAMEILSVSAQRWPGVESARQLYKSLIAGCLRTYSTADSYVVHSPSNRPSPASSHDVATPPPFTSPTSAKATSVSSPQNPSTAEKTSPANSPLSHVTSTSQQQVTHPYPVNGNQNAAFTGTTNQFSQAPSINTPAPVTSYQQPVDSQPPLMAAPAPYTSSSIGPQPSFQFDPSSLYNPIPSIVPGLQHWDPNYTAASTTSSHLAYHANVDPTFWMGSIGDEYSQFFNQPYPVSSWRGRSLSHAEQAELLANLVQNPPQITLRPEESATYYNISM